MEQEKQPLKVYYSIGEVADMFGVNTSLIRFWEKEFDVIKPPEARQKQEGEPAVHAEGCRESETDLSSGQRKRHDTQRCSDEITGKQSGNRNQLRSGKTPESNQGRITSD